MEQPRESGLEEKDLTEEELRGSPFFPEPPKASDYKTPEEDINRARENAFNAYPKVDPKYAEERIEERPNESPVQPKTEIPGYNANYRADDFYDRLGVSRDASSEEITKAYRDAAKKTHPDAGGDKEDFKNVQEAFERLNDPLKRAKYDAENPKNPESEQPKSEESEQKTPAQDKGFGQRFKEGVKRGAKAFAENYTKEEAEREVKAQAEVDAEKKRRQDEVERVKKEAEEKQAQREAEKSAKEAEKEAREKEEAEKKQKAEEAQREKEKRAEAKESVAKEPAEKETGQPEAESQEAKPWEKWGNQEKVAEKYFQGIALSAECKANIKNALNDEIGEKNVELAKQWFEDNKGNLSLPGGDLTEEVIVRYALDPATGELSKEVVLSLQQTEEGKKILKQIDNARALGVEFEKERTSPESQFLMLNHLQKRSELLQLKPATEKTQRNLETLFQARKELSEKLTGKDPSIEALLRVKAESGYESKDDYVKVILPQTENTIKVEKMDTLDEREWADMSDKERADMRKKSEKLGLSEDQFYALLDAGYGSKNIRELGIIERGLFGRKVELSGLSGKKDILTMADFITRAKDQEKKYLANIKEKAEKEAERRWEELEVGQIIKEIAMPLDRAVGGVEAAYKKLKQDLIDEYNRGQSSPKTKEQQKQQNKEFGKTNKKNSRDTTKFFKEAQALKSKLTGNLKEDSSEVSDFLGGYGFDLSPKDIMSIGVGKPSRAVKKQVGFLRVFLAGLIKGFEQDFKNAS